MLRFLRSRLLLMIPTWLGIASVTFLLAGLVAGRLPEGEVPGEVLPRRLLSPKDAERLRKDLGFDRPLFYETDVRDRRRMIAEELDAALRSAATVATAVEALLDAERRSGRSAELASDGSALEAALARAAVARARGAIPATGIPASLPDEKLRALLRERGAPVVASTQALAADTKRLLALGDLALDRLAEVADGAAATGRIEAGYMLVLGEALAGVPVGSLSDLRRARDERAPSFREAAVAKVVEAVLASEPGPARAAAEEELRRLGGFAVPALLAAGRAGTVRIRAAVAPWLTAIAGFEGRYPAELGEPKGDPPAALLAAEDAFERFASEESLRFREIGALERYGLRGITEARFYRWLRQSLTGDFGRSLVHARPVADLLRERLPLTVAIQAAALVLAYALGVPLGLFAARRRRGAVGRATSGLLFLVHASPEYWLAALAIVCFHPPFPIDGLRDPGLASRIADGTLSAWSPAALADLGLHLCLPLLVLALGLAAVVARFTRASVLDALGQEFVRSARAKGLGEAVVLRRHVLRAAAGPLVTLFGSLVPALVGGSVVVERAFNLPGLGLLAWDAAQASDLPLAMALATLGALATMAGHLTSDLLHALVDPRVRLR